MEQKQISFVKGNKTQLYFMSPVGAEFRGAKTVERVRLGQKAVLECAPQGDQPIRHNSDLRDIKVYINCFYV